MEDAAGWIAPAATMIAAMMTAANLGARFTGWGFIVFTVGSIGWIVVGATSGQTNLVASNAFLSVVNLVGIWRWLGRQARFDDTAKAVEAISEARDGPDLFAGSHLQGMRVLARDGTPVAAVVDVMMNCSAGCIDHLIIREGGVAGVGETLRLLPWKDARVKGSDLVVEVDAAAGLGRFAEAPREPLAA